MSSDEHNADHAAAQDELLVRAAEAVNRGELTEAHVLAGLVLSNDGDNLDAGALLATESQPAGEVRRLTVMFCDLVGSTTLSSRLDPELYRGVLHRYRKLASTIAVERHGLPRDLAPETTHAQRSNRNILNEAEALPH